MTVKEATFFPSITEKHTVWTTKVQNTRHFSSWTEPQTGLGEPTFIQVKYVRKTQKIK